MLCVLLFVTLCWSTVLAVDDFPRADTENGPVVGIYESSYSGFRYKSFMGIPYAKPPVNGDRFKEAQRLEDKWIGDWNAKQFGSPCLQVDQFTRTKLENGSLYFEALGDEDCLFINVFTQDGGPKKKNVLIFIHGGAFMWGGGHHYGPDFIMDRPDIVFVTFNYRLGPLGFLTTGDDVVPGNNGLKDQVAALQWVRRNIANFGGDPTKVTLVGLSAGGASVDYMYLSPLSKGLFKRGYSLSGSSLCPWAQVLDGVEKSRQLAKQLGCPTCNSRSMIKCLRRRPARLIIEQIRTFQTWLFNPFTIFGPVIEVNSSNPFIDQHPRDILKQGLAHDLPWVAGVTKEDGLYPAADFVASEPLMRQLGEEWQRIGSSLLFLKPNTPRAKQMRIVEAVKNHYMGTAEINHVNRDGLVRLLTERLFMGGIAEAATLRYNLKKSPVSLYLFGMQTTHSVSDLMSGTNIPLGCCHGDDLIQFIRFKPVPSHTTPDDRRLADLFKEIVFTYASNGTVPEKLKWEPVSSGDLEALNYLNIDSHENIKMSREPLGELNYLGKVFGDTSPDHDEL